MTESELRISNESYTKKDFYQIYPEILDLVKKISNRWDPAASNESDPGVVLLKLLAFVADKINYNIDKNILECFMTSATQEDSMRKLCDMMGYDMKYLQAAVVDTSFMYTGTELNGQDYDDGSYIKIPAFTTTISDDTGDNNYVLLKDVELRYRYQTVSVPAMEGKLLHVSINNDEIIRPSNLDDKNRFYLPETQIAENGIWVYDVTEDNAAGEEWQKITNLNTQLPKTKCWKFAYDSRKKLPYIQFPNDVLEILTKGLYIRYIQTKGAEGSISAKTLSKISNLDSIELIKPLEGSEQIPLQSDEGYSKLVIQNVYDSSAGKDIETLDEAYEGFKKQIGTFDTLITCRDYANAIYNMTISEDNKANLVSNVVTSDIRNDINFVNKVVTYNESGLITKDIPLKNSLTKDDLINHFDLYVFPLNPINNTYRDTTYTNSFKVNTSNWSAIVANLNDNKTIAHNITRLPENDLKNIFILKNYYKLNAKISTTYRVDNYEIADIKKNINIALYDKFNARKVEFGKDLAYDEILKTIETADSRIKSVSLDEPEVYTKYMLPNNEEFLLSNSIEDTTEGENNKLKSKEAYQRLVAKNVLAGRLNLFNYNNNFEFVLGQTPAGRTFDGEGNILTSYPIYGKATSYLSSKNDPIDKVNGKHSVTWIDANLIIKKSLLYRKKKMK